MSLSLQDANLVRQKVYNALQSGGANGPAKQRLWWTIAREFFRDHVSTRGNANLQFVPFSEADADGAAGTPIVDAGCKVYLFYVKKLNAATANVVKLFNDVTDDTTTTDQELSISLDAANQEAAMVYPTGYSFATGIVVTQHTTIEGATSGSDGGDGFIVIGAA